MLPNQPFAPMVEVTRGGRVESLHRGAIAVVDSRGHLIASWGNPGEPVYVRSSAKPFQALALVCSGAADAFAISDEELAVICGSHSGEPMHVDLVQSILAKARLSPKDLLCGIHPPFDPTARRSLMLAGEEPTVLHNNCSGKHAGMLVAARHLGLSIGGYVDPEHDLQVAIRGLLAYLAGMDAEEVGVAIDGCSVPTFHLPLRGFALAMARLAAAGEGVAWDLEDELEDDGSGGSRAGDSFEEDADLNDESPDDREDAAGYGAGYGYGAGTGAGYGNPSQPGRAGDEAADSVRGSGDAGDDDFPVSIPQALERIWQAMKNHPILIAGSRRRICTDLMRVAGPLGIPLVAKSGAEGVYAMAVVQRGQAYGIALKVEDGSERARNAAALETIYQLGLLPGDARETLAGYHHPPVRNLREQSVGEVRARFRLNRGLPG